MIDALGRRFGGLELILLFQQFAVLLFNKERVKDAVLCGEAVAACCHRRTLHGSVEQFYSSIVKVKPGAKVITISFDSNMQCTVQGLTLKKGILQVWVNCFCVL
jgi:hypothetical protein